MKDTRQRASPPLTPPKGRGTSERYKTARKPSPNPSQREGNAPSPLGEGRGEGLRRTTFRKLVGSVNSHYVDSERDEERTNNAKVDALYSTDALSTQQRVIGRSKPLPRGEVISYPNPSHTEESLRFEKREKDKRSAVSCAESAFTSPL